MIKSSSKYISLEKLLDIQANSYRTKCGQYEYAPDEIDSEIYQKQTNTDVDSVEQLLKSRENEERIQDKMNDSNVNESNETNDKFFKRGIELNDIQKEELIEILTKRCGQKVKTRIRSIITYDFSTLLNAIYSMSRFYISKYDNEVHYCAGQSYPCEIKSIRQEIMRRFP